MRGDGFPSRNYEFEKVFAVRGANACAQVQGGLSLDRSKTEWFWSAAVFCRFGSKAPEGRRTPGRWREFEKVFAVRGANVCAQAEGGLP